MISEAMRMQRSGETDKQYLGDVFRMIDCTQRRHGYFVKLNHNPTLSTASYAGVVTCGSVWACPVCAAKIQERRRGEIEQALSWHQEVNGGQGIMVTFTFPHVRFDTLRDLLSKQAHAFKLLRKGRKWDELKKSLVFRGLVRSLEVTHGDNGWHPHTHELWLTAKGLDVEELRERLVTLWRDACMRACLIDESSNLDAFNKHSVHVRDNADSGDYLAKQDDSRSWGMAAEIAKASSKSGRAKGVHPHHFLVRQAPGDDRLYLEYVKGMKGKRQLFWSHGLKGKAGILDVSDEELAEMQEKGSELLAAIPAPAWKYVTDNEARVELLDAVESSGWSGMINLLQSFGVPQHHMPLTRDEYRDRLESLYE